MKNKFSEFKVVDGIEILVCRGNVYPDLAEFKKTWVKSAQRLLNHEHISRKSQWNIYETHLYDRYGILEWNAIAQCESTTEIEDRAKNFFAGLINKAAFSINEDYTILSCVTTKSPVDLELNATPLYYLAVATTIFPRMLGLRREVFLRPRY